MSGDPIPAPPSRRRIRRPDPAGLMVEAAAPAIEAEAEGAAQA